MIKAMDMASLRFLALSVAVVIYALLGSPTPDHPGLVEAVLSVLLITAAGLPGLYNFIKPEGRGPLWRSAGRALLIYGITFPLAAGVMRGADAVHILRDMLPFVFMGLPLFMHDIFHDRPHFINRFILLIIFSGLMFAARAVPESVGFWRPTLYDGEPHYFSNAPSVLFAAIFLSGLAAYNFIRHFSLKAALFCILCAVLVALPLAVMVLTIQRASLGMYGLSMIILAVAGIYRYPQKSALLILIVAVIGVCAFGFLVDLTEILNRKTMLVGLNMRSEEMAAAWQQISAEPVLLFFGTGWGGTFESPAVFGIRVNYTHSLLSAILLKTGLVGLILTLTYIIGVANVLIGTGFRNIVIVIALGAPLFIDVVFYAAYKSLDFGFILLLATLAVPAQKVATGSRVLYSNLYTGLYAERRI